ncbi:MAG TPA: methyl-accepting chemotaxis protein [Candidatus Limnocylindrales bacterium]|nr:methyl-accepting chemotaxis protein [Candidatus Limnocylindrales bacterium]
MKTISYKFFVLIIFFILVPLIALGFISFTVASRALQENSRKQYEQMVWNSKERIDERLADRIKRIESIRGSSTLLLFSGFTGVGSNRTSVDNEVYALQKGNGLAFEPPTQEGDLLNFGIMLVHPGNQKIRDFGVFPSEEYVGLDGVVKQHIYAGGSNDEDFTAKDLTKLNRSDEVWFQEAKNGRVYISDPRPVKLYLKEYKPSEGKHPEKVVEKKLIVIAMPHLVQNQVRGVLMVTTTPDFLYQEMERLKPEHGQAFIINSKGWVIGHSDKSLIDTQLDNSLVQAILEPSMKEADYNDNSSTSDKSSTSLMEKRGMNTGWTAYQDNLIISRKSQMADWTIGLYVPQKDILSAVNTLWSKTLWIIVITLGVVWVGVSLFTRKFIIMPLKEMVTFAEAIRNGDLTRNLPVKTEDEIGKLGKALNAMLATLRTATSRIRESSTRFTTTAEALRGQARTVGIGAEEQLNSVEKIFTSTRQLDQSIQGLSRDAENLSSASEETSASTLEMKATFEEVTELMEDLSSSVNETASSIEQMMMSVREVSKNTHQLLTNAETTYKAIDKINASIQEVSSNVDHSRKLSEETTQAAVAGQNSMQSTLEGMREIKDVVLRSAQVIQTLGDRTEEIGAILDVINDIAEQTSLLALNASIIAAQAGEHGKGFAVVAGEVRELANRSTLSAKEIGNLIKNVQKEALMAIQAMQEGIKKVEEGVRLADVTGEMLKQIITRAEKSASTVSKITQATQEQADSSRRIMQYMENVTHMIAEITKATGEQQKSSSQIITAVENMRNLAAHVKMAMGEQTKGVAQVIRAMDTVTEIALRAKNITTDQTREASQIVSAIQAIREVIEKNLESIKKTTQIADDLLEHSKGLLETVSQYKIE